MAELVNFEEAKLRTKTYKKRQIKDKNEKILIKFFMSKAKREKTNGGTDRPTPDRAS